MDELRVWLGDIYYRQIEDTVTKEGYTSEYHYVGSSYELVQLPYEETVTTTKNVIDYTSVSATIFVVLTFITCVTMFRKAILGR